MKSIRIPSVVALAVAAALAGCAATQQAGQSAMDSVKSLTGQAQVVRQDVAPALYEVVYSPSEDVVYAVSAGNHRDPATGPGPKLFRLDPETLAVKSQIDLPRPGYGLALDDEAHRLYTADTRGGTLMVVDTVSGQVIDTLEMPPVLGLDGKPEKIEYREIILDRANRRLYMPAMAFSDNSKLQVVNLDTMTVERTLTGFGFGATGASLDAAAGKLYVSNLVGQLHVVDTGTLSVTDRFEIQGDQLLNLVVDDANKRLIAVDQGYARMHEKREKAGVQYQLRTQGNQVLIIDPSSGRVVQNVKVGTQPVALLLDAQRNRLYVSNRASGNVSVVDPRTGKAIRTIDLPQHPNSFALNPKTGAVYVTVKLPKEQTLTTKESVARISF